MTLSMIGESGTPVYELAYTALNNTAILGSVDGIVKATYMQGDVSDLVTKRRPWFSMINKSKDFYGSRFEVPIIYAHNHGIGASLSDAQTTVQGFESRKFQLTRTNTYGVAKISHETLEATSNDKGAFVRAVQKELDGTFNSVARLMARELFQRADGRLADCRIDTDATTAQITLENQADMFHFELNMRLSIITEASNTLAADYNPDTDAVVRRPASGKGYVIGVNRSTKKITVSVNTDIATTYTDTPVDTSSAYLCALAQDGFATASGGALLKTRPAGFLSWCPTTAPVSGDNHFGVDRSDEPDRLAGIRSVGTGKSNQEAIKDAGVDLYLAEGTPTKMMLNPVNWSALEKELASSVVRVRTSGDADFGFEGIRVMTAAGPIDIFADPNCPVGVGPMVDPADWTMKSLRDAPRVLDTGDGLTALRESTEDASQYRIGARWNVYCEAPGRQCNLTMPAL